MSEPIKVGDLVVVVRPQVCCGSTKRLGAIFTAEYITGGANYCANCETKFSNSVDAWQRGMEWSMPVDRLKRIPPLNELEGVDEKETLHA